MSLFIVESIFFGFGIFILLTFPLFLLKKDKLGIRLNQWIEAAIILIRFAGIGIMMLWTIEFFLLFTQKTSDYYSLANRMFGPYWFAFWSRIFVFSLSLLLWFNTLKKSSWVRVVFALLILFVLNVSKIVLIITSFHRDYIPGGWNNAPPILSLWLKQLSIFTFLLTITYLLKKIILKKNEIIDP